MNYSKELKAAKIFNLSSLNNLTDNIFISNQADVNYYSMKRADNNRYRKVKDLQTSKININPTVRIVHLLGENKKYSSYLSFAVEPKDKSTGIAIVSLCNESNAFLCDIRILPLNTLSDIADPEEYSQLLTVNLDRSKFVLKTDITVALTENSEPLYSVDEVDVTVIADLVTQSEVIELKRELEFQGSKLAAHYLQEVLAIFRSFNMPLNYQGTTALSDDAMKKVLLGNAITGCIFLEIIGSNVIKDLNRDWTSAGAFIGYLL